MKKGGNLKSVNDDALTRIERRYLTERFGRDVDAILYQFIELARQSDFLVFCDADWYEVGGSKIDVNEDYLKVKNLWINSIYFATLQLTQRRETTRRHLRDALIYYWESKRLRNFNAPELERLRTATQAALGACAYGAINDYALGPLFYHKKFRDSAIKCQSYLKAFRYTHNVDSSIVLHGATWRASSEAEATALEDFVDEFNSIVTPVAFDF